MYGASAWLINSAYTDMCELYASILPEQVQVDQPVVVSNPSKEYPLCYHAQPWPVQTGPRRVCAIEGTWPYRGYSTQWGLRCSYILMVHRALKLLLAVKKKEEEKE